VIASSFKVKNSKFFTLKDNSGKVLGIIIEAHDGNLEDFYIPKSQRIKIDKFIRKGSVISAKYYFKIPLDSSKIKFYYFNTIKQKLIPVTINRELKIKSVKSKLGLRS